MTFSYHRISDVNEASDYTADVFTHDDTSNTHHLAILDAGNTLTLFAIPMPHADKVCSRCSVVKLVRASFLSAQWIGTRHRERSLWSMRIAARVTPTLMPGAC